MGDSGVASETAFSTINKTPNDGIYCGKNGVFQTLFILVFPLFWQLPVCVKNIGTVLLNDHL
jgi:hypothetical protein